MLQKVMELVPRQPMRGPPPPRRGVDRVDRTHDGRSICFNCNRPGHIGRHCPSVRDRNPNGPAPDLRPRESWQAPPSLNPHAPTRGPSDAQRWDARGHDSTSRNNYQRNDDGWRNGPPPPQQQPSATTPQSEARVALSYATEKDEPMDERTVIPVLRTDVSRLITQTVWVE